MRIEILHETERYAADLSRPVNITIPCIPSITKAFQLTGARYEAFRSGDFVASVAEGSSCNVDEITLIPHGNGTHTECIGHITSLPQHINDRTGHFNNLGVLITARIETLENGDSVLSLKEQILHGIPNGFSCAIIRTPELAELPDYHDFSGTNPPYFLPVTLEKLRKAGIKHLVTDLPSVDREQDGGKMAAHKAFWEDGPDDNECTITELVKIPLEIKDGLYFVQMATAPLFSDASPSTVLLYTLEKIS